MANVFYVVMFMLYTIMEYNNNNLHCEAATSLDINCVGALLQIKDEITYQSRRGNYVRAPNGTVTLSPERCGSVPNTKLSGSDLVLCKCKAQEVFGRLAGIIGSDDPIIKVLNMLNSDKDLAKSCGFDDIDCNTAFQSVITPCEAEAREVMETCGPMVKAAAEKDQGSRGRQRCCSMLNGVKCTCSSYTGAENKPIATKINEFLQFVNDKLRDECSLSAKLYKGPVCKLPSPDKNDPKSMKAATDSNTVKCLFRDMKNMDTCGEIMRMPRTTKAGDLPLIDHLMGCCLDKDMCKCDPRSVSCCQKLGKLSKNKRDSCMCELLNSTKTLDSTLKFLNFVRSNINQINSCSKISPVYTDTCAAIPDYVTRPTIIDPRSKDYQDYIKNYYTRP